MGLRFRNIWQIAIAATLLMWVWTSSANRPYVDHSVVNLPELVIMPVDSPETDLPYPFQDEVNPYGGDGRITLTDPSNMNNVIEYDVETGEYYFYKRIGDNIDYRSPTVMNFDEYMAYIKKNSEKEYWKEIRSFDEMSGDEENGIDPFAPSLEIKSKGFDRIFGGNKVEIKPQGTAELIFGANTNYNENPQIPVNQRRITTFNFDQRIQLNVVGQIGEKMQLSTNYNTEATFDFENQTKIEYEGYEDEIIQKLEAGNVSMPLNNSLISGSQSLFGVKSELRFGKLTATTIFSQERGQKKQINVQGGAQTQEFEIGVDDYEFNRHFFLSGYFRAQYNQAMRSLPVVNSGVQVTRIEVWVVNQTANVENTRNIIGFTDLGEDALYQNEANPLVIGDNPLNRFPANNQNQLYSIMANDPAVRGFSQSSQALSSRNLVNGRDFERLSNARMLTENEYTFNERLGFISLNQSLNNDEVLAVGYQYTLQGTTYQVGDLSNDGITAPDALFLKMLKATVLDVNNPIWDLMMKNVYSLGAFQINNEDFILDVWYNDPGKGIDLPIIPDPETQNTPLIRLFNLDRIDQNGNPQPDGRFDFVDNAATMGGTIQSQNGRIYFPVIEPFGSHLQEQLSEAGMSEARIANIAYPQLYDSTKIVAQQNFLYLNRFKIKGSYKSASSDEISLNTLNIPQGAVQVTAGGVALIENQDFTVDYNLGRVKILNTGLLESQTPISISVESNTLFSIQTRRLMGARFDYRFHENFNIGATIMNLNERPLTQKVNIGDEPMNNTLWGLDVNYQTESRFMTDMINSLPFLSTAEESRIDAGFEFAQLLPGHNKVVGQTGAAYIDDFEGTISLIDLRNFASWALSSIPQGQTDVFPEANRNDDLSMGYRRAKFSWYIIDPLFFRNDNITPDDLNNRRHYQREVTENEVFPDRELPAGTPANIATLDMAFYPNERGPYNYDAESTDISDGVDPQTGLLNNPETRWGGVMRPINTTDFEQTNVEFVQFWIMDPYNNDSREFVGTAGNPRGRLLVHLGNVSEDVLRDGQLSFENGLPLDPNNPNGLETENTEWGRVPTTQSIVNAFDNTTNSNQAQDVGYDGWNDAGEREFYSDYLDRMAALPGVAPAVLAAAEADPSSDNFLFFRSQQYDAQNADVLERYKAFNGFEGNSVTTQDSPEPFPTQATVLPTTEDLNQDLTLAEAESYYEYVVDLPDPQLVPDAWQVGTNYITDVVTGVAPDGRNVSWYQFKIPVRSGRSVNNIQDLRSIRFLRMTAIGFETPVVLRFARLELIRGEWRRYTETLREGEFTPGAPGTTEFDLLAVNIEENSQRTPLNYVTPPGILREIDAGTANLRSLNEQSLVLLVRNLEDGDARAAFRSVDIDMRMYGNLEMFIHGESIDLDRLLEFGDVTVFVRLGTDFRQNFYEYEIPVIPTQLNASSTPQNIWPEDNNMTIEFKKLQDAKSARNASGFPESSLYTVMDGNRRIRIRGNPVLSSVRTVMIGVRNPTATENIWVEDDGLRQSAEIWVNELRLTDFNNEGGWAAVARVNAQLADLGTISLSGNISTPNFGSLESRVAERPLETSYGYDAQSNLELGKFLPEESGIKVPLFISQAEQVVLPKFDPLAPDLELSQVADDLSANDRRELRQRSQTYTRRRSINLTNLRKERTNNEKKPRIYDIENWNATVAYSERQYYDFNTEFDNQSQFRLGLGYNFALKPNNIKPFAQSKFLRKSDYFNLLKDFNFNLVPKSISFRSDILRTYNEQQFTNNVDLFDFEQPILFTKVFNWNRVYDVQYDMTQALRFTYSATNLAFVNEPIGRIDRDDREFFNAYRDTVMQSILSFGDNVDFRQTVTGNYKVPIDKIPILDWISVDARYTGNYNWQRAPFSQDTLGNVIQNSRNISLNGQANMLTLYNKLKFFKEVNQKFQKQNRGGGGRQGGRQPQGKGKEEEEEDDQKKERDPNAPNLLDYAAKMVMSLKNVSLIYSQNEGTLLPGYNRTSNIAGMDPGFNAPGIGFVLGHQFENFNRQAALKGWMVENEYLNSQYLETYTEDFNFRVNLEPLPNLRVEINAQQNRTFNDGSFFRYNNDLQQFLEESSFQTGSFTTTMIAYNTLFDNDGAADNVSETFQRFKDIRVDISNRLAEETGFSEQGSGEDGYADGFGETSQQVVIPAFLAAYTGQSADDVKLAVNDFTIMDAVRNPNWTINYDGLSKIPALKKYFRNVTVAHAYRSTYSVNNFTTNLAAGLDFEGRPLRDNSEDRNFIPTTQIQAITISEQLSPLIRIDMTWQNSLITNFEISRNRTLAFSTANFQLTENNSNEYVIGAGYRFPNVEVKIGGKKRKSDLNVRADLSIRDTEMIARRMEEETNQITSGQNLISIKTSIDYVLSDRLNIRFFYDHQINEPKVSISFPTSNINTGISLRFTLTQ
ncbi:MAG: cell surface protein SprA [Flavobacteriales bacterium]|nr:cell surface protein SprA [Flavobacteriales bacterium]